MGYKPTHLGHVNLYVRNAEKSHQWYKDILGLHTYDFVPGRAAFLCANPEESHEIALMEVGEDAPGVQEKGVGLNHLAWRMDSLDDLKEIFHRLEEKNVEVNPIDHGISLGLYFRDPDGNGIEVYFEQARSQWFRQEGIFMGEGRPSGQFPGPWDEILAKKAAAVR